MMTPLQDALNRWSMSELRHRPRSYLEETVIDLMVEEALDIPEEPIPDVHKTRKEWITHIIKRLQSNPLLNNHTITINQHIKSEEQLVECDTARGKELLAYIPAPVPDGVKYVCITKSGIHKTFKFIT